MPYVDVNGLQLFHEASGDPDHPALLLISGLGSQLIDWPDEFLGRLVDHDLYVIRFDNRDIGLSTAFDGAQENPHAVVEAVLAGNDPHVAYTLADMADDAAGLLRALDLEEAHVVGLSMGGMIAQSLAIRHPEMVLSLSSIMSSTGGPDVGQPSPAALEAILSAAPGAERPEIIAHNVKNAQTWASPDHIDAARLEERFQASWDRTGPQGPNGSRQLCAILASPQRDEALADLTIPTVVVHGTADTLVNPSGGQRTADVIPGSRLVTIEGMGHDLVPAFVPTVVAAVTDLIDRVDAG